MSNKEAVKKLIGLLAEYRKTICFIFVCLLASTGLNLCIPLLSRNIMNAQDYAKWFGDTVGGIHEIKLFNI